MVSRVVQGGRVEEDAEGSSEAGEGEDVEEEAINDHADVLPVPLLLHKKTRQKNTDVKMSPVSG